MDYTQEEQKTHRLLWAEALESGKYQQCTGVLHRGDQFCIMGVACDISGLITWKKHWRGDHFDAYAADEAMYGVTIPESVRTWLGLAEYEGMFNEDNELHNLVNLNDNETEFSKLAAIIRREPAGLFG